MDEFSKAVIKFTFKNNKNHYEEIIQFFFNLKSQHDIIQFKNEYRMIKSRTKLAMQGG